MVSAGQTGIGVRLGRVGVRILFGLGGLVATVLGRILGIRLLGLRYLVPLVFTDSTCKREGRA